ncbi:asparagine synthase-related protein [Streptomyces sp. NBC_01185]|uniref:asparagine synthase-related protein n=1 Tax=Streptomyces sp. NBC_01185 TaxID=2903764 RepID=UPI00386E434D|nr:asparagine synthase C-terminal domain-containing protein [Streptomyces sp. NBC_01185]
MAPLSKWCVVSNAPLPDLAALAAHAEPGALHVYHRGPEGAALPGEAPFVLDVGTLRAEADGTRDPMTSSTLRVDADAVVVRISGLNEDPVHYAVNRMRGLFAYFTDLFLAPLVLPGLGLPVEMTGTAVGHACGTLLRGVSRLPHSSVHRTRYEGGHWRTETGDLHDPLRDFREPHRTDPAAAGEAQLDALTAEIERIDSTTPAGTGYATLLSGGIDSGTVTYLAATAGLSVTPYSVGTPWGDELADAAELCAELGIGLEAVHLTEDDIIASIPEAVRWLGVTEPEVVEVALTATSVQRLGAVPADRTLLTGYGSDLINAGLYRPFAHHHELIDQVLSAVDRTRRSNELSGRMALAHGTGVHHPFWSWPVMRVALETAPECKVREGREKYHLRTAMGRRVPEPIAWRKKIAVHHGGGLQDGVARRLEKETGSTDREPVYRACFAELLDRSARGELEPVDPPDLFERALGRVRFR